jgi:hypothetical protein
MSSVRSLESIQLTLLLSATAKNVMSTNPPRSSSGAVSNTFKPSLSNGIGENQANRVWDYRASLVSGASLTIDVYDLGSLDAGAGAGKDLLGLSVQFSNIAAILIQNVSVDDNTSDSDVPGLLEIQPDSSNGWTPIGTHTAANGGALEPGGVLLKVQTDSAGFTVTDAVSHQLKLTANSSAVDFQILILGRGV